LVPSEMLFTAVISMGGSYFPSGSAATAALGDALVVAVSVGSLDGVSSVAVFVVQPAALNASHAIVLPIINLLSFIC
jgi:hypothetical protein